VTPSLDSAAASYDVRLRRAVRRRTGVACTMLFSSPEESPARLVGEPNDDPLGMVAIAGCVRKRERGREGERERRGGGADICKERVFLNTHSLCTQKESAKRPESSKQQLQMK
jgi:hypothetical protein